MSTIHQRTDSCSPSPPTAPQVHAGCWFGCARLAFRALIVDDDDARATDIGTALERLGMQCARRTGIDERAATPQLDDLDVVILAHQLARRDGVDGIDRIRTAEQCAVPDGHAGDPVPIILVGAPAEAARPRGVGRHEIIRALSDPLDTTELLCTLCMVLGPSRHGTSGAGPPPPPIDLEQLRARCMGNEQLVTRLLTTFVQELPAQLDALDEALADNDTATAVTTAHRLKGSAGNLAMDGLRGRALRVEEWARADRLDRAASEIAAMREQVAHLCRYISVIMPEDLISTADRR